jgi:hypothetical protein
MVFGLDRIELTAVNFRRERKRRINASSRSRANTKWRSNTLETHAYSAGRQIEQKENFCAIIRVLVAYFHSHICMAMFSLDSRVANS